MTGINSIILSLEAPTRKIKAMMLPLRHRVESREQRENIAIQPKILYINCLLHILLLIKKQNKSKSMKFYFKYYFKPLSPSTKD